MRVLFPDNDLISEKQLLFMIGVVKSKQRDVAFFAHRFVRPNFQATDSQNMRREDVHRLKTRTQAVPQDKDIIA